MTPSDRAKEALLAQLEEWVKGTSVHDDEANICVPDFSCCRPNLGINLEDRQEFMDHWLAGDTAYIQEKCLQFLDVLIRDQCGENGVCVADLALATADPEKPL